MPSLQGKAEFSFSHHSVICKERRRRGGQRQGGKKNKIKKCNAGTTSSTSACLHSRMAHMHTLLLLPTSPGNLQPKSRKGEVFHTHNRLTSHQPAEGLISTEVTAAVSPSNSEDHTVLMPTLSFLLLCPPFPSFYFPAPDSSLSPFFFLPSSVSYPPSCPPLFFSVFFFSISSPFCTAPLCTAPVLPHCQGGITTQNAGSGGKEGGREEK